MTENKKLKERKNKCSEQIEKLKNDERMEMQKMNSELYNKSKEMFAL